MNRQPHSFDTLCSPSTTTSYSSEILSETINSFNEDGLSSNGGGNGTSFDLRSADNYSDPDQKDINNLSLKFEKLQHQIEILNETQTSQDERYKKSKQENDFLLNRIHSLEDQLRELEVNSELRSKEDERKFKETMAKQMKTKSLECEQHLHSNYLFQQEIFKLKTDLLKSDQVIQKLRSEKEELESELNEKQGELSELDEELHKLKLLVKNLKQEESVKSNIISILNEQLEVSQNRSHQSDQLQHQLNNSFNDSYSHNNHQSSPRQRSSSSRRSSVTSGYGGFNNNGHDDDVLNSSKATIKDFDGLETSLNKLKEENKRLKEANEELQAQILNIQLEEGRSLVEEGNKSYSLADELGDIDVTRLMKALKEQQDDNIRLRKYMDDILSRIVDKHPEILEKSNGN